MKKARILLALLLGLLAGYWARPAGLVAQSPNRAALVVRAGDQQVQTACVEFNEPEISGLDLLMRSGLEVEIEAQGLGALVCSIDGTGCGAEDCWCQCKGGGDCVYWSYWLRANGGWQYAQIGSIMTKVTAGSIQGWSWGPGAVNAAIAPPSMTFEDVCTAVPEDRVTPGAAIVVTVPPTAVAATPQPTLTSAPTPTLPPTATPLPTPLPASVPAATAAPTVTMAPAESDQEAQAASPTPVLVAESAGATSAEVQAVPVEAAVEATAIPRTRSDGATAGPSVDQPSMPPTAVPTATAAAPLRAEAERAKIAAAPAPAQTSELTVVGSGVALPTSQAPSQRAPEAAEQPVLSYVVFLILSGSLAIYLLYARLRAADD